LKEKLPLIDLSLNHSRYVKTPLPKDNSTTSGYVPAVFFSGGIEQEVYVLRQDLDILKKSVDSLNQGFEKLLDIYEREHGLTHNDEGEILQLPPKVCGRYIQ
jgi:hypothetical protein